MRKTIKPKIGMRFGILTIISDKEIKKRGLYFWKCKCDCGTKLVVWNHNLLNGNTKACRCVTRQNNIKSKTHGMTHTRPWEIWHGMKRRCNDSRRNDYKRYGGRRISVCKKWDTFMGFWKDMKKEYSNKLTIDRINNDGDYCKENCRWATQKEQMRNKRNTLFVTFKNETLSLVEFCERKHKRYHTIYTRIYRYNWNINDALTIPIRKIQL